MRARAQWATSMAGKERLPVHVVLVLEPCVPEERVDIIAPVGEELVRDPCAPAGNLLEAGAAPHRDGENGHPIWAQMPPIGEVGIGPRQR